MNAVDGNGTGTIEAGRHTNLEYLTIDHTDAAIIFGTKIP
jgi:hypothetical protein